MEFAETSTVDRATKSTPGRTSAKVAESPAKVGFGKALNHDSDKAFLLLATRASGPSPPDNVKPAVVATGDTGPSELARVSFSSPATAPSISERD